MSPKKRLFQWGMHLPTDMLVFRGVFLQKNPGQLDIKTLPKKIMEKVAKVGIPIFQKTSFSPGCSQKHHQE